MLKFDVSDEVEKERTKYKVYCKNCGHSLVFFPFENKQKKICGWCKHAVYVNDKVEFEDRLRQQMGRLVSKEKK